MYHFDFGAVKFDLAEDGKDYPTMGDSTASLTKAGPNHWQRIIKKNGTEVSRTEITLSEDENSMHMKTAGTRGNGSAYSAETTSERVGTGTGVTGTWRDVKMSSTAVSTAIYTDAGEGRMQMEHPESKSTMTVAFDGKPATEAGPRAVPGEATTFHKTSPTEIKYMLTMKEQPYVEGVQTVSSDGKTMKDVSWLVSQPTEKEIAIFERQ